MGGRRGVKAKTLCTARGPANHSVLLLLCREFRPRREKLRGPGQRGGPHTPAHSSQGRPGLPAPRLQSHEGQGGHSWGGQTTGSFRGLSIRPLCPWQRDHSSSCRTQAGWGALGVRGGQLSCCCGGPDGRGLRRQSRAETEPSGWGPGLGGGSVLLLTCLGAVPSKSSWDSGRFSSHQRPGGDGSCVSVRCPGTRWRMRGPRTGPWGTARRGQTRRVRATRIRKVGAGPGARSARKMGFEPWMRTGGTQTGRVSGASSPERERAQATGTSLVWLAQRAGGFTWARGTGPGVGA